MPSHDEDNTAQAERGREASRIIANLTHELKTPLHSILAVAGLLYSEADGPLNDEQRKQVDVIQRSAGHLLELITNLLNFSSAESRSIAAARFDLRMMVEELLDTVRPLAEKSGVKLEFHADHGALPFCSDKSLVRLTIANLVGNAVKFSSPGGAVSVYVQILRDGALELQVADSGIGMEPAVQAKVFEEFYQAESSDSRRFGGVGLGLALVRSSVRRLRGTVDLASEPGQGTLFTVKLPSLEELLPVNRVLVLDQDEGVKLSLKEVFGREGHLIEALSDERELLRRTAEFRPELVIVNLRRPVEEGLSLIRALKGLAGGGQIAVLAMSSLDGAHERSLAFGAGADDFIAKPFDLPELMVRAEKLLQERRIDQRG